MINGQDLLSWALEVQPAVDTLLERSALDPEAVAEEMFNMDAETLESLIESMADATSQIIMTCLGRGEDPHTAVKNGIEASLKGALHMGMQLERQFGQKSDLGGVR